MITLGNLFDGEFERAMDWWMDHQEECEWASGKKYAGAIGGALTWEITKTSIGDLISIRCHCGWRKLVNGLSV